MSPRHLAMGLFAVLIWGVNFVVIDFGLDSFPPLLFAALRFLLVAVPAVFFIRKPDVPWKFIILVGLFQGVGQFGLLFVGMNIGAPPGLASLLLQSNAFFTIILAYLILRERPGPIVGVGVLLGSMGLGTIAFGASTAPLVSILVVMAAGLSWACANITLRIAKPDSGFRMIIWSSLVAPLPLYGLSLVFEGPHVGVEALTSIDGRGIFALLFTVILSTIVAFSIWANLLRTNKASQVGALTLLVPVIGMLTAWLIVNEVPGTTDWIGGSVILVGVFCVIRPDLISALVRRGSNGKNENELE